MIQLCEECNSRVCEHRPLELKEPLSLRQKQILFLLSGALSNREIASALGVSEETIKASFGRDIFPKLGAANRVVAAFWARDHLELFAGCMTEIPPARKYKPRTRRECSCGKCPECLRWNTVFDQKFADPDYYSNPRVRIQSPNL